MSTEWELQRDLRRAITRGEWAQWVRSTPVRNPAQRARLERKLANTLGFEEVPKGRMSLGWIIEQMTSGSSNHYVPDGNNAELQAAQLLSGRRVHGQLRTSTTADLVFNLMFHRECLRQYKKSAHSYHGRDGRTLHLYEETWTDLNSTLLEWAMMLSPLSNYDEPTDERIKVIRTDEQGRLHCDNGPAVITSENRTIMALHGVQLDTQLWGYRNNAEMILKVQNVEQRRVLIEDMGTEEFIRRAGIRPVHKDETGQLYKLESTNSNQWSREREHMCWVHVTCPSTEREYMLAVPPNTRTAREGVAWTFRKLPEEYHPQQET